MSPQSWCSSTFSFQRCATVSGTSSAAAKNRCPAAWSSRWDPSLIYFLGVMLCQNKFQMKLHTYIPLKKIIFSFPFCSSIHRASLLWWSSSDTAADSLELSQAHKHVASVVALSTDGRREWGLTSEHLPYSWCETTLMVGSHSFIPFSRQLLTTYLPNTQLCTGHCGR